MDSFGKEDTITRYERWQTLTCTIPPSPSCRCGRKQVLSPHYIDIYRDGAIGT